MSATLATREKVVGMARGCVLHLRLQHPDTKEWVPFTEIQWGAIRKIYEYCGYTFLVEDMRCDKCKER